MNTHTRRRTSGAGPWNSARCALSKASLHRTERPVHQGRPGAETRKFSGHRGARVDVGHREALALPIALRALHRDQRDARQAHVLRALDDLPHQLVTQALRAASRRHRQVVQADHVGQRLVAVDGQIAAVQMARGVELGLERLGALQEFRPVALGLQGEHGGKNRPWRSLSTAASTGSNGDTASGRVPGPESPDRNGASSGVKRRTNPRMLSTTLNQKRRRKLGLALLWRSKCCASSAPGQPQSNERPCSVASFTRTGPNARRACPGSRR
ncbi:hypothetical protein Ddc_24843 [Ditylenchus destructor]|nr:hypothetical protein Ddc_24843 [Ditylenchus destructor]